MYDPVLSLRFDNPSPLVSVNDIPRRAPSEMIRPVLASIIMSATSTVLKVIPAAFDHSTGW
jgi:hypothetical protein